MSRICGKINEMNNYRTFIKERQIDNKFIDLLNKQRIIVPLILDRYAALIRYDFHIMCVLGGKSKSSDYQK